jgi:hypothetical protein
MRTAKTLGGVGALLTAALLGGTMISSAFAESPSPSPAIDTPSTDQTDAGQYCELFRSKLADELSVSESQLESAAKAAAEGTIDQAVSNGDLTQDMADRLKERLTDASDHACFGLRPGIKAFRHGFVRGFAAGDLLGTAADALDMQTAELVAQLHAGKSLTEIAQAQGVDYATVSTAVVDAARADLDKAVDAGRITQDRADQMLDRLQTALDNGEWPPAPRLGGPGRGHDGPKSSTEDNGAR